MYEEERQKIIDYFEENELPKPVMVKMVGKWALGDKHFAVTCGLLKIKRYAVYFRDDEIVSVRFRG